MTATNITIEKLSAPIRSGDWHDRPANWVVYGPGGEFQLFTTKKDATTYARCRRMTSSLSAASRAYAATP